VKVGWSASIKLTLKGSFGVDGKFFNSEFSGLRFPVPGAGFRLPQAVVKVLGWILPSNYKINVEAGVIVVRFMKPWACLEHLFSTEMKLK
jgi:hypothetical protein